MKFLFCILALLIGLTSGAQSVSQRAAVAINATVQASPARITLSWRPIASTTSFTVYRKLKTATSWGSSVASPSASDTQWADNTVTVGVNYEYKIVRVSNGVTGTGYISTGIQVPSTDYRGKIILLVDNSISAQIVPELTQLIYDMRADGWIPLVSYVAPTATVPSVRAIVQGHYNADPANVKALYIVGHVPVPYSGNITPDGHDDGKGARPTDGYYADVNGTWTDNTVNNTISTHQQADNVPGDGKFDQSDFPSAIELQVGRVDMRDMPAFSANEVQLIKNYLNKAHSYKIAAWAPTVRGVMIDNLQWVGNPIAASGFRTAPMIGLTDPTPPAPVGNLSTYINNNSYLWTYHYGGGQQSIVDGVATYSGVDGGATTTQLATTVNSGGVFNMSLGSFYYDFDNKNNYLRAMIARGDGLANMWVGIPAWYFHHMAMGDNIGYSVLQSMNNTSTYVPLTEGWQTSIGRTHMNLMGDPSVRMKMLAPPTNLVISDVGGHPSFSWTASNGSPLGYHVYRFDASGITRLTTTPVVGTTWTSTIPYQSGVDYMVRAVKTETNFSGSYENLSLGSIATSPLSQQQIVRIDVKAFLEGPFNGTIMHDSLRVRGFLPLSSPYASLGYTHTNNSQNETIAPSILNVSGNAAIVDWIIVELRSSQTNVFASRTGLLRRDGKVVDMDGVSPLEFNIQNGSYYVALRHRNHLSAMSSAPVSVSSTSVTVDFTSGTLPIYGTAAMKQVGSRFALWAGDVNRDGIIKYSGTANDRDVVLAAIGGIIPTNTVAGYRREDANMDGKIMYTGSLNDRDIVLTNIGGVIPTNTKPEQLPQP